MDGQCRRTSVAIDKKVASLYEQKMAVLRDEIARRPVGLRLPHKGFRFRTLRSIEVDMAVYFSVSGLDLPINVSRRVIAEGEVLQLAYEPVPAESTHCNLVPCRYDELEALFVSNEHRRDEQYVGYSCSVSYIQLAADFEWLDRTAESRGDAVG